MTFLPVGLLVSITVPVVVVVVFSVPVIVAEATLATIPRLFHFVSIVFRLAAICAVTIHVAIKFALQILDVLVAAVPVIGADVRGIAEKHKSAG